MEFLVHITVNLPADMPEERRRQLVAAESAEGRRLRDSGKLVRIWRIPGRYANVGIWSAADATELHQLISALPLFPWLGVDVQPLASHPIERGGQ